MTLLCAVGLFASIVMARKAALAARGLLSEPSVVQSPRATALGKLPNAWFGLLYYPALALAAPFVRVEPVWAAAAAAAALAAAFSLYLAYSLLFVTRAECRYCWTSHAVNWSLLAVLVVNRPA